MKKPVFILGAVIAGLAVGIYFLAAAQQQTQSSEENFYTKSLHYTNRGLEYWYAKEQGGLERITGIPISKLDCSKCHVRSCDTCHKKDVNGKEAYSLEPARAQDVCQGCHGIESLDFAKNNKEDAKADVHFKKGMKCLDCHSAREIHGDGTAYNSIQQPGALDVRCEKCHEPTAEIPAHRVHGGKVDCNACHVRDVPSCYNCHFDTKVKEGKSVSITLSNLLFLVNHDGKVTLANLHTFVFQNKTLITFAPSFPHWVMKEGRKCGDCHNTPILQEIKKNSFSPVRWQNGEIKNAQGVVPVLEGQNWNFVFLNFENGKWTPIQNPAPPLLNYSGYCRPLTREQLDKLEKPRAAK